MKILLFYTPRTGSTSILNYFEKLNPNYECFNEYLNTSKKYRVGDTVLKTTKSLF
jgi:hypothetical protein